ncbi:hypothetical protein [Leisingera sp. ANG-M1]|uniref:hypothetical protein n=1 Tax=Leisingera sp. ANG-M1 TaxID=1577895 RepID=UPI0019D3DAD3|nr:hypothetical protein [Leisingera sp. ANG-M1]
MYQANIKEHVRHTIAQGTLLFDQRGASVWFKIVSPDCEVIGPLNVRSDWAGRTPGVMPVVQRVGLASGECISLAFVLENSEVSECWYSALRERLLPAKIFEFCEDNGWSITSFKSKPKKVFHEEVVGCCD